MLCGYVSRWIYILCYNKQLLCFCLILNAFHLCVHRWQVSGTGLEFALMASGLSVAKPIWRPARPSLRQLKMEVLSCRSSVLCECERTDRANIIWIALKYLHWRLMRCLCDSNDTCQKMENLANKTEVPGKFTYKSRREYAHKERKRIIFHHHHPVLFFHIFSSAFFLFVRLGVCEWHAYGWCEVWWVRPDLFLQHQREWNLCH